MKLEKLVGDRFKERPADCVINSHALMVRGGYIKQVGNGLFSSYAVMKRVTRKIEEIIRQEMDAIDGQEVLFPVVMPGSLWEESGRFESIGKELLRFTDRNDTPMLLGLTHEEAAVHLVREYGNTYTKYPFMIYQIQTKFRDEARPRAGIIRAREFTMKDAYSYHTSQEDLDVYYKKGHRAYERIFSRTGLPEVLSFASDPGMMGGKIAHEFMFLTPVGEDSLVICRDCDFRANMETVADVSEVEDVEKFVETIPCPKCGKNSLNYSRGIEVGNIFQLGDKYTKSMGMSYTDADGTQKHPVMGCYGIGVGRTAAAVIEQHHDDYGPIWPISIAPWHVHLCCVRSNDEEAKALADKLYEQIQSSGTEVIYDDRPVSAGVMFSDADLLGVPIRIIVSPRNIKENICEVVTRDKSVSEKVEIDNIISFVQKLKLEMEAKIR